jgi:hypothetical protein
VDGDSTVASQREEAWHEWAAGGTLQEGFGWHTLRAADWLSMEDVAGGVWFRLHMSQTVPRVGGEGSVPEAVGEASGAIR